MNKARLALIAAVASIGFAPGVAAAQTPVNALPAVQQVALERVKALDSQINVKVAELQARKARIRQLQDDLAKARNTTQAKSLQTQFDALAEQDRRAMLELQSLINQRNLAADQLSNLVAKASRTNRQIINNIRP